MSKTIHASGLILVHEKTGQPVTVGEEVTDFRGDKSVVTGGEPPRHEGSTGRVHVERGSYFPSVFDLVWVKEPSGSVVTP